MAGIDFGTQRTAFGGARLAVWLGAMLLGLISPAFAQTAAAPSDPAAYPRQPIKLLIGFAAGGGNDIIGRVVGQKLSERLGPPVVIENTPGAGGAIAADAVARAAPDGHTLLIAPIGTMIFNPALFAKLPYDPQKNFAPITILADYPLYLTVSAELPVKSVQDLIAWGRANPTKANYGSTSGVFQLITEQFKAKTGTAFEHIPFKSTAEMITALLTGQATMAFVDPTPLMGHVKTGKVRVLATSGAKRSPDLPEAPTMAEAGVPGVAVDAFTALVAPFGTPPAIVAKLQAESKAALASPDVVERFKQLAVYPVGSSSEELASMVAREIPIWKEVAAKAGIKLD